MDVYARDHAVPPFDPRDAPRVYALVSFSAVPAPRGGTVLDQQGQRRRRALQVPGGALRLPSGRQRHLPQVGERPGRHLHIPGGCQGRAVGSYGNSERSGNKRVGY